MSAAAFWMKINGILIPTPAECPITQYDMQSADSGRDESANMRITQVRGNLTDCEVSWEGLTVAEAILIRNVTAPVFFTVSLHFLGETIHFEAYKGDRKWTPAFTREGKVEKWDLSMKITAK